MDINAVGVVISMFASHLCYGQRLWVQTLLAV